MAKNKGKKYEGEGPWYLMYLFLIPLFLIAIVPEGFFTWQVILIFGAIMSTPFVAAWWLWSDNSPMNKNVKRKPFENMELYSETLKRDRESHEERINNKNTLEG